MRNGSCRTDSLSRHLRTIVSRSRSRPIITDDGRGGSASRTCLKSVTTLLAGVKGAVRPVEAFVEDDAEAVDVGGDSPGPCGRRPARGPRGSAECRGPWPVPVEERVEIGEAATRQAEVGDVSACPEGSTRTFDEASQVAVDDAVLVGVVDGAGDVEGGHEDLGAGVGAGEGRQGAALDELHREVLPGPSRACPPRRSGRCAGGPGSPPTRPRRGTAGARATRRTSPPGSSSGPRPGSGRPAAPCRRPPSRPTRSPPAVRSRRSSGPSAGPGRSR